MQTRLTKLLRNRAPGHARRHGRCLVRATRGGRIGGRRIRMPRSFDHGPGTHGQGDPRGADAHDDCPSGSTCSTAMPGGLEDQVRLLIEEGASVFVAGLGVPAEVVALCHEADVLVVNMCGKVEHARRAVQAGCDLVVAQGTEAGGHTGQVATMPLVPQIVDAVGELRCRSSRPVASSTAAGSRRRWPSGPTASGWAHDSSPHPRRAPFRATRRRCSGQRGCAPS